MSIHKPTLTEEVELLKFQNAFVESALNFNTLDSLVEGTSVTITRVNKKLEGDVKIYQCITDTLYFICQQTIGNITYLTFSPDLPSTTKVPISSNCLRVKPTSYGVNWFISKVHSGQVQSEVLSSDQLSLTVNEAIEQLKAGNLSKEYWDEMEQVFNMFKSKLKSTKR